ncbi:MAG TPA: hypothetical protein VIY51_20785 [Xanthobacteraceae bacterium]
MVCVAIAVAGVVWWSTTRLSLYRRLFAVPHLMQFAQGIPALKQAAMRGLIASDAAAVEPSDDARILRTSAGLALVYTISKRAGGSYVHHASVSIPGRVTAHAVGETFVLLWAKLLGVEYARLTLQVSPTSVHHAEFVLDAHEQSAFAQRAVEAPAVEWLQTFQAECEKARQSLRRNQGLAAVES